MNNPSGMCRCEKVQNPRHNDSILAQPAIYFFLLAGLVWAGSIARGALGDACRPRLRSLTIPGLESFSGRHVFFSQEGEVVAGRELLSCEMFFPTKRLVYVVLSSLGSHPEQPQHLTYKTSVCAEAAHTNCGKVPGKFYKCFSFFLSCSCYIPLVAQAVLRLYSQLSRLLLLNSNANIPMPLSSRFSLWLPVPLSLPSPRTRCYDENQFPSLMTTPRMILSSSGASNQFALSHDEAKECYCLPLCKYEVLSQPYNVVSWYVCVLLVQVTNYNMRRDNNHLCFSPPG